MVGKEDSGIVFEDIYLSLLLWRHCRNGVFKNFKYLLETRIMEKQNNEYDINRLKILTTRDKEGYTLLHCAAEGGSVDIFKALIEAMHEVNKYFEIKDRININDTTHDGLSVLHLACKNKHRLLCRYLLIDEKYKDLLLRKISVQCWSAAHFAAVGGDMNIMDILESNKLEITVETKNGLNILDIACIHNNTDMCKELMDREDFRSLLDKSDARGWTIAHFAAMVGNTKIFDLLIEKKVDMVKTKNQKNILHVCCEYGHKDLCKIILKRSGKMVNEKDDAGWNALHYAAKGGNLEVFREIENCFGGDLCETTRDERTVLHIACINNRTAICKYICNKKSYKSIINSTGERRGWTAAHYVAVEERQDGTEKTLIRTLVKSGIDLKTTTVDKLTVLGVACEHRNISLINYLLNNHNELLDVEIDVLKAAAKASNSDYIESKITEAIDINNHKTVRKGGLLTMKDVNVKFKAKHGSEEDSVLIGM